MREREPQHDPVTGEVTEPTPTIDDVLEETERVQVDADALAKLAGADLEQRIASARKHRRATRAFLQQLIEWVTLTQDVAASCIYAVPRAGKKLRGPSIRFAELVAAAWGNLDVSTTPVDVTPTACVVRGVCRDLQTNLTVAMDARRLVQKKRGSKTADEDQIQLAVASGASIARRNAILAVVPRALWEQAYNAAADAATGKGTMEEKRERAIGAFRGLVPESDAKARKEIEARVCAALGVGGREEITLGHLQDLVGLWNAVRAGDITLDEALRPAAEREAESRRRASAAPSDLTDRIGGTPS